MDDSKSPDKVRFSFVALHVVDGRRTVKTQRKFDVNNFYFEKFRR